MVIMRCLPYVVTYPYRLLFAVTLADLVTLIGREASEIIPVPSCGMGSREGGAEDGGDKEGGQERGACC